LTWLRICNGGARGPAWCCGDVDPQRYDRRDMAGAAPGRGSDQAAVGRIDAIAGAVAPEEVETGIQLHPWRQLRGQRRMEVEEVAGAERGFVAEVVAPRVEGIEGAEPVVVGIPVAAGDADEQRQSGLAASVFERMSGLGGQRPGTDAGIAETSPLDDGFPVPVPPVPLAERARTDGPAALACGSLDVAGQVIFVVQHVDVPGRGGCAAGGVDAAQYLRRRAGIVETARAVLPRGCGE